MDFENNNNVFLKGAVISQIIFSHSVYGEDYYSFSVEVKRVSETNDIIPVVASFHTFDGKDIKKGDNVAVRGELRSYKKEDSVGPKVILKVFAKEVDKDELREDQNICCLKGEVAKEVRYRKTPFGREITDALIKTSRSYKKFDFIPCILWGKNARLGRSLEKGRQVEVLGRIQSRIYEKQMESGEKREFTTIEVSISEITA